MKVINYLSKNPVIVAKYMVYATTITDDFGKCISGFAFNNLKGEIYYFDRSKKDVIQKAIQFLNTEIIIL